MNKLIVLPLEPLEERYTKLWYEWFAKDFERLGIDYAYVDGNILTDKIETGSVLDAHGTNYWKLTQLAKVVRGMYDGSIGEGDTIFDFDLWHTGLECIPYINALTKKKINVTGIFHAGTYDHADFTFLNGMEPWGEHLENAWFNFIDAVFVGSKYHKELISKNRNVDTNKVHVTGLPLKVEHIRNMAGDIPVWEDRPRRVIFPHRFDKEKNPVKFMMLMDGILKTRDDIEFVITTGRQHLTTDKEYKATLDTLRKKYPNNIKVCTGLNKYDYYNMLGTCRVMWSGSLQETFGYGTLECMVMDVIPVVPRALSYIELLQDNHNLMYERDNLAEGQSKMLRCLDENVNVREYAEPYQYSVDRMIEVLRGEGML